MIQLKQVFCKHKNNEVVCWHWTRGWGGLEDKHIEVQLKCNDCKKYYFVDIRDIDKAKKFASKHMDREWSDTCMPVLRN